MPRLLLLSDCSAEASVSGQLLLYRLLRDYDPADLTVIEGDVWPSNPARRLPGVPYHSLAYKPWRFQSRLYRYWNTVLLWSIHRWAGRALELARVRQVEAVLTVAHGHLWLLAAAVARRLNVPLHLILHDDWPSITPVAAGFRNGLRRRFQVLYEQAVSRLCVSPFMEREYARVYGRSGAVLLPCRGEDSPPARVRLRNARPDGFVLAYAGSIPNPAYAAGLRHAADIVANLGGRLDLYTNASRTGIATSGLDRTGVRYAGFHSPRELAERVGATADALFLPMSFAPADRSTTEVCFPSKLVDYTAIGLPIVIWGPEYSSAARWASENPDAALCVTDPDSVRLAAAVRRLADDPATARRLAETAVAVGNRQFAFAAAAGMFRACLREGEVGK